MDPTGKGRPLGLEGRSTLTLLGLLAPAAARRLVSRIPMSVRQGLVTLGGLVALATPVLLWISWSITVFYWVLGVGVGGVVLVVAVVWFSPEERW